MRIFLKSKLHKATVTEANLQYTGSIAIDRDLMDAAGLMEYEKVLVVDNTNGNRLETYVIEGDRGTGTICMNGAAAHLVNEGDEVTIMSFHLQDQPSPPKKLLLGANNTILKDLMTVDSWKAV